MRGNVGTSVLIFCHLFLCFCSPTGALVPPRIHFCYIQNTEIFVIAYFLGLLYHMHTARYSLLEIHDRLFTVDSVVNNLHLLSIISCKYNIVYIYLQRYVNRYLLGNYRQNLRFKTPYYIHWSTYTTFGVNLYFSPIVIYSN